MTPAETIRAIVQSIRETPGPWNAMQREALAAAAAEIERRYLSAAPASDVPARIGETENPIVHPRCFGIDSWVPTAMQDATEAELTKVKEENARLRNRLPEAHELERLRSEVDRLTAELAKRGAP